jgi:uncharacterized protein with PQ loop repeat
MAIGLVIYFAYSYTHSKLGDVAEVDANTEVPATYKPPIAAMIAIILAIVLTLYQVPYLMNLKSEDVPFNLAIRLFAWLITGVLVGVLMYGKGDRSAGRTSQTRNVGLMLSLANLVIWAVITWYYFGFIHPTK